MSVETRTLRPFDPPPQLEDALKLARFHMGNQICEPDSRIVVETPDDFLRAKPVLSWADDDAQLAQFHSLVQNGAEASGVPSAELGLVVLIYTRYLQIANVALCVPLNECQQVPRVHSFASPRPRALQASTHGAVVSAQIALLRQQPKRPLAPWRKGTWLAKVTFRLALATEASLFHPTPLTDQVRAKLGLPRQTARYVELDDYLDLLLPFEKVGPPTFYVDEELLSQLDSEPTSPRSKALQAQLVLDFITAAVATYHSRRNGAGDWDDLKDSLLGRIVRLVAGAKASPAECRQVLARLEDDPAKFVALAENALNLRRTLAKAFAEPQ